MKICKRLTIFADVSEVIACIPKYKQVDAGKRVLQIRITEYELVHKTAEGDARLGKQDDCAVDTTVGRAILSEILPKGLAFSQHRQITEEKRNW